MNKELREMLEQISNKKAEAKQFLAENKIDEAKAARDEAQALQNKFDIAKDLYDQERKISKIKFLSNQLQRLMPLRTSWTQYVLNSKML
jgi:hypothetical protein